MSTEKVSHTVFDQDTQQIVRIFQKVYHVGHVERDQVKYVERYRSDIKWAGRLFKFLTLAKRDKQSPLGWRPTPLMLNILNEQSARKSKPSRKPLPVVDRLIVELLIDAVIGNESYKVHGSVLGLGFDFLQELGLMHENRQGETVATPLLIRLFALGYYNRQCDEIVKGKYPVFPPDQPRDELVFAPVVRPK